MNSWVVMRELLKNLPGGNVFLQECIGKCGSVGIRLEKIDVSL